MRCNLILLVFALLLAWPSFAQAADCFAGASYWIGFRDFWFGFFRKQNGMILAVLACGATGIFMITRGRWKK